MGMVSLWGLQPAFGCSSRADCEPAAGIRMSLVNSLRIDDKREAKLSEMMFKI